MCGVRMSAATQASVCLSGPGKGVEACGRTATFPDLKGNILQAAPGAVLPLRPLPSPITEESAGPRNPTLALLSGPGREAVTGRPRASVSTSRLCFHVARFFLELLRE